MARSSTISTEDRAGQLARELAELLEQQAATSEVLHAIGRAGSELEPIFEAVLTHAMRLCDAEAALVFMQEGDYLRLAKAFGGSDEYRAHVATIDFPLTRSTLLGRVGLERRAVMLPDVLADPEYERSEAQRLGGFRTIVGVPMLIGGEVIGVISLWRREVDPFSDRQIELATTFAAEGAIAVRNANLMKQLEERTGELARTVDELEALRDVGEAVSSSLDLQEVLSKIVMHAVELSGTEGGSIFEFDDDAREFRVRTAYGTGAELLDALRATRIGLRETMVGRAASTGASLSVANIADDTRDPHLAQLQRHGWRSVLAVPLLRESRILGALVVRRRTPGEFSTRITKLVEAFAGQSSLAIQNARLFEEVARKGHELEVASRHKSEFLAGMSHELRTPLNAVIGFSEVLLQRLFGDLNAKQEEYLEDIRDSGRHLLELLNDILDLSKVEAGKMDLELASTSLREAVEHGVAMVRDSATEKRISLGTAIDEGVDAVPADPLRLRQVILNLLSNAVKFTPEGGRVDVGATRVGSEVRVSVADNGGGIAEADQALIFDAFQQARRGAAAAEGTGLGLTLSRRIVELHGGRLWVKSRLGEGSTFTFALPAPEPEAAAEEPWPES